MNSPRRKPGFIVLVVMIVIVMITLAGLSFVLNLSTENKAVHLQGDQLQLKQALASGVELLRGFLDQPPNERQRSGGWLENTAVFQDVAVTGGEDVASAVRFSVISPRLEHAGVAGLRYGLQDESARLNLALLPEWERRDPGAASRALMNLPGMHEAAADAILDWIDADASVRPAGAEAEYYTSRGLPYEPRNGVPAALEELLLVRDISRLSLFGPDQDVNYRVDSRETQLAGGTASDEQMPWAWLLTVSSGERNRASDGSPRIDLNDPDLRNLHRQLSQAFNSSWADFVVAYRQFGPDDTAAASPRSRGRGVSRAGSGAIESPRRNERDPQRRLVDLSVPARYEFESALDLIGVRVTLPARRGPTGGSAEDIPPALESPLEDQPERMREYLPNWMDLTTTTQEQVIRGRVNINEAPRAVLLGVPGLDASMADRILAARGAGDAGSDADRRHPVWLLTERIVELPQMRQLLPYVCGGGDVFRAQVVAFDGHSRLSARAEVVLDATVSPPRQVYWKDLGLLGRGFTAEELGRAADDGAGEWGL